MEGSQPPEQSGPASNRKPNVASTDCGAAIYTVCDARFFLGLAALINSLRLHGHQEPIYVVDCGLTDKQRAELEPEANILHPEANLAPQLLKYAGPLQAPADVMILVDADIIVTASLEPLKDTARHGKIVAFTDALVDRFSPEWATRLELRETRRQPYVNSGFLVLARAQGVRLLELLEQKQRLIELNGTILADGKPDNPFYFPDQDVLNALLASNFSAGELAILDHALAPHPPFEGISVVDPDAVRCAYEDGQEPYVLHHVLQQKPWLAATKPCAYSVLLPRLWVGRDVAIRLASEDLPHRFRSGARAGIARAYAAAAARLHHVRGQLGLRHYLRTRREDRGHEGLNGGSASRVTMNEKVDVGGTNGQGGYTPSSVRAEVKETPEPRL